MAGNARPPIDDGAVLITGASAGIGRELAVQLAPRARMLILLARRAGRLEELRASLLARRPRLQVLTVPVDLSDENDVERALAEAGEQAGAVDVLVNNAGVGDQALADQADWTRVRTMLRTNVLAVAQLTTALVPAMVKRGRGGVLNMGSGAGLTVMPAAAAYSASKHFMDGFSEALRADLTGTGVVVTQVCPGPVDSEFDQIAGSAGGMTGGPPQFLRISAAQCAREALAGFDRGVPLVFPGRAYRIAMRALPLLPRELSRRQAARSATRIRRTAGDAAHRDRPGGQAGRMRISRLILSGAAIGTIIGTGRADLNSTHVFNPAWPPHARFHNATGWGTVTGSQLLALWLLWRPGQQASDHDTAVTTAALLSAAAWVPFFPALAISGADVEDEPGHLPRVAGVPVNLVPAALIPASCALGYLLHRHGR